jgi:signal transduction histidine kinase
MKYSIHSGRSLFNAPPKSLVRLFLRVILPALVLLGHPGCEAQEIVKKSVLLINEVGISNPGYLLITQPVMADLQAMPGYQIDFYSESLDSMTFPGKADQDLIRDAIVRKYSSRKLDLIVAYGPSAIRFMVEVQNSFLPDVPVIICGSTEDLAGSPKLGPRFRGTWMGLEPSTTVELARMLLPKTEQIFVVVGESAFDRTADSIVRKSLTSSGVKGVTYLKGLSMGELQEKVQRLPDRSIVLYASFFQDAKGQHFANATVALPMIVRASNAPVWGLSDTYIDQGIVGGHLMSFAEQGKVSARMAEQILRGKVVQDIPIATLPSVYMFDSKELKRWGIHERDLPPGSVLVNRELSLWERSKEMIIMAALVILTLCILTAYLLAQKRHIQAANDALAKLSGHLINAQEKERRRLALELHDDFSQRMAVLSLGLETALDSVSESPDIAKAQLHQLLDSAGEIGADLHTISHRLHSSTLESLGLVAGVSSFCKEFNAQQGVRIGFVHNDIPKSISPEVALCMFRIVQEGLRNIKKHSGTTEATVELRATGKELQLTIQDKGIGFDVNRSSREEGIGIHSMEERVRLVGGQFSIHSALHEGTRIDVAVPCRSEQATRLTTNAVDHHKKTAMAASA